jgi:carboxyl-terminal processing protease
MRLEENQKIVEEITAQPPDFHHLHLDLEKHSAFAENYAERKTRWRAHFLKTVEGEILSEVRDSVLPQSALDKLIQTHWEGQVAALTEESKDDNDFEDYLDLYFLNAMTLAYDPHSTYFNEEMNEEFTEELSSTRLVFGITYNKNLNGELEITEIMPGSAAWYSEEIKEGAVLREIHSSTGQYMDLRGAQAHELSGFFDLLDSDSILLVSEFDGEVHKADLVRSRVYADNDIIKTAVLEGSQKIGYISLPDFYTSWTDTSELGCANDVAKAILKLKKADIGGLILDLRDNGGGSLYEAVDLVGIFIDFGPILLIQDASGNISTLKDFNRGSIYSGPLMVLINSESASASEVVAGTLQDYQRALIAGQRSYGKATGQSILPLNAQSMFSGFDRVKSEGYVKTTDIGLYRLSKETAQLKGVEPDIELPGLHSYTPLYEAEEPHAIRLDSIDKKVYFTPLPALPTTELFAWYESRYIDWLDSLQQISEQQRTLLKEMREAVDLKANHARLRSYEALEAEKEAIHSRHPASFTAQSYQFDENLLRMSPYLGEYNRRFLDRLHADIELNEAFLLMLEWAEIK